MTWQGKYEELLDQHQTFRALALVNLWNSDAPVSAIADTLDCSIDRVYRLARRCRRAGVGLRERPDFEGDRELDVESLNRRVDAMASRN